jgi:drug/metabolite transporter (DMT)-like permease
MDHLRDQDVLSIRATASFRGQPSTYYRAAIPLLALLWGFNWPAVKVALMEIGPWAFRASAMSLGGAILAGAAMMRGNSLAVRREHWLRLVIAGLLSIAAFNILLTFAQLSGPTSRAAIVTFTMPIWTVVFARIFLGEKIDRRRCLGLALGAAGLVALGWPLIRSGEVTTGLFLSLAAGICWALGTIVSKRFPVDAPPLTIATWQVLVGAACAIVGMVVFEGIPLPHPLKGSTVVAFLYHVLLSQALAYLLWFAILAHIPAGTASLGTLMVPPVGVYGAMLILGEQPTLTDFIGLLLVIGAAASVLIPARHTGAAAPS